jgi:sterol 3beta-glucosyltransferase
MEDAHKMTQNIINAIEKCGVRAIVSKGWSKLGTGFKHDKILFIDDCPHGMSICEPSLKQRCVHKLN